MVNENEGKVVTYLGATAARASMSTGKVVVGSVVRGSGAWNGGLNVNDEVVTIDGAPAEMALDKMTQIANRKVGDVVKVSIVRDGLKQDLNITLTGSETVRLKATVKDDATPVQMAVRKKWMTGK